MSRSDSNKAAIGEVDLPTATDGAPTSQNRRLEDINDTLSSRYPSVFIVGFGKTGTKALYEALKLHPQLTGPLKEMRFFSLHYSRGLKWYLSHLPSPALPNQHIIEKSPDYVITKGAAKLIRETAELLGMQPASLKFVVVLRNPIARAVSEYLEWNSFRKMRRRKGLPPFSQLVLNSESEVDTSVKFLNSSLYAYHINAGGWFKWFSKTQFCFVNGDKFRVDPSTQVKKLEECLGLQAYLTDYNFVYNKERKRYCLRDGYGAIRCLGAAKGRTHPHVPKSVIDKLKSYYRLWNKNLYQLLEEDFRWDESEVY